MSEDQAKQKHGIKESLEMFDFAIGGINDLAAKKADDGKISTAEWIQTALANAPAGIKAFVGVDKIDEELKDLDADEQKQLAAKGLELAQAVAKLMGFGPKE